MAKRVSPEAALLMLHWQNSVCDPKGVWGKNLCRQIEKNNAIRNAHSVLATARNRGLLTIFVNIGWRPGFPELPENQHYPLLQGAKDENKGIVGTWEVDVIDALRPMSNEPIVINFGSDSFVGRRWRHGESITPNSLKGAVRAVANEARDLAGMGALAAGKILGHCPPQ